MDRKQVGDILEKVQIIICSLEFSNSSDEINSIICSLFNLPITFI